ncbi:hypothetical protein ACJDT4_10035 [Clostridium neuense]|uniref:Uncharacterized protein n=1 Tax=Clostridium neuense TaxID=1728934 RepID=A0ABW8TE17_9CLOT
MEKTIGDFLFKGKSDSVNVYKDGKLIKSQIVNGILFKENFDKITESLAKSLKEIETKTETEMEMEIEKEI